MDERGKIIPGGVPPASTTLTRQQRTDAGAVGAAAAADQKNIVYVRPHDVLVMREATEGAIPVRLEHLSFAGPVVRATLRPLDGSDPIEAELTRERYKELGLKPDEELFVNMRNARVFEDYSI